MSRRLFRKVGLVWSILFLVIAFGGGSALAQAKYGTQVMKNLYHVHTRVLWDLGWVTDYGDLDDGYVKMDDMYRALTYGPGANVFLSPFEGYGIPAKPKNAYRKVRLYVYYGNYVCVPHVVFYGISGGKNVDFSLPSIGGNWGHVGANWSDFKDLSEYEGIGHANIYVYLMGNGTCGENGTINRIEAHFYDGYGKDWAP